MPLTFSTPYIRLADIKDSDLLVKDYGLFNSMTREAISMIQKQPKRTKPANGEVRKAGGGKRRDGEQSVHTFLKDKYHCTDYFVTSVESAAKGILTGAKEQMKLHIDTLNQKIKSIDAKIASTEQKLDNLLVLKKSLIERSQARKAGKPVPPLKRYRGCTIQTEDIIVNGIADHTRFIVQTYTPKGKPKRDPVVYDNDYLFELLYLDPKIKALKSRIGLLTGRRNASVEKRDSVQHKLDSGKYTYRMVSSQRQRRWSHLPAEERTKLFKKYREQEITLAGRHDAKQGNWLCRYDALRHVLTYRSTDNTIVSIQNVVFPYGQKYVNDAVDNMCPDQKSVAWTFHISGNKIQIRCTVTPRVERITEGCANGVIGIDMNYDNISVAETNCYGHLVRHDILRFEPEYKTSGQLENRLSLLLEEVFKRCIDTKKPLVVEDVTKFNKSGMLYGNAKRNRKVSLFAYTLMTHLAECKASRYGVELIKVNPAYTSKIGALKYQQKFGLSRHEAAAYTIARRGQGFKEKIPQRYRGYIASNVHTPLFAQRKTTFDAWKALFKALDAEAVAAKKAAGTAKEASPSKPIISQEQLDSLPVTV